MDEGFLSEASFDRTADAWIASLEYAFSQLDPDEVDVQLASEVLTVSLRDGTKIIINKQRPARQIWMAALRRAWHFDFDGATHSWRSDKGHEELFVVLEGILSKQLGRVVQLERATATR